MIVRNFFLLIATSWITGSFGQDRIAVSADFTGVFNTYKFSSDGKIPPKRRDKLGIGDEFMVNGYFHFTPRVPLLVLYGGIGYREAYLRMRKRNLGDVFLAIFFQNPTQDTFHLNRVSVRNRYVNIPLGFSVRTSPNPRHRVGLSLGLQANLGFLTGRKAELEFDPTYANPGPTERAAIEKSYEETSDDFGIGLQPRIDVNIRLWQGGSFQLNMFPFIFTASTNPSLAKHGLGFSFLMGLKYGF